MANLLDHAEQLLAQAYAETLARVPANTPIFDAHVHVGTDIDGFVSRRDELVAFLDESNSAGAFVFCLDEPDRIPAFTAANNRTIADAAASNGKLLPFVRLDLEDRPTEEARRVLDLGARGIKLHPRSQRFSVGDDRLDPIFALSAEYGVPILIHGGRGLPPIADDLERLVSRHEDAQLIIAHAGVADLERLTGHFGGRPGVFFDTSAWSFYDLIDLYGRVAPEQILYASDYPYGQQPGALRLVLSVAETMGFSEDQLRAILGGTAQAIADGSPPAPTTPPGVPSLEHPVTLLRIHHYLAMAIPLLWSRMPDTIGVLGLALNTTRSNGTDVARLDELSEYLGCARDLWGRAAETEDKQEAFTLARIVMRLLHVADIAALSMPR